MAQRCDVERTGKDGTRTIAATIGALAATLLIAGCGGANPSAHPSTSPSGPGTLSALSQKSFTDGEKTGESIAIPNESDGQIHANCGVMEAEDMPAGDISARWILGCYFGTMNGLIKDDQG